MRASTVLGAALLAAAGFMSAPSVLAQDAYPSRPVTLLVGFPPGTATDTVARLLGERLAARLGQPFVVDNKPGVGGSMAAGIAARAKPDGYTLLVTASAPMGINPHLYGNRLQYDPRKDFAAISALTWLPYVLVTQPSFPASNLQQLIELARKKPGGITFATIGNGTTSHLVMAVLGARGNFPATQVPYKGSSQAQTDVIGGQVDVTFDTQLSSLAMVRAGRLKALAVSTPTRTEALPDVPTVSEQGLPGYDMGAWLGLVAPAGIPLEIQNRLAKEIAEILNEPAFKAKIAVTGGEVRSSESPQAFAAFLRKDYEDWGRIVREFNVKAGD